MASSQTKLTVWNLALDLVSENAITDPNDNSAAGRWLQRNYDQVVAVTLRAYPWGFAKERFSLSAAATDPSFKWAKRYKKPAGTVRVLPITRYGERNGVPIPFEIVGDYIETNEGAPLRVHWLMDKSNNPGVWDALFTQLVYTSLAVGLANKFPGKVKYLDRAIRLQQAAKEAAEEIESFEGTAEPTEEYDIIRVRDASYTGR